MPDALIDSVRSGLASFGHDNRPHAATGAAVLIPFIPSAAGWSLIFTRRAETLSHHKGEISFPGGRIDPGESGEDAALREAHEELGIVPADVEVLGRLASVFTFVSGFSIEPWVGIIPRAGFVPNPAEIAEVLEIPVDILVTPSTRREQRFIAAGEVYSNYAYDVGPNIIWGATARILTELLGLIPSPDPIVP